MSPLIFIIGLASVVGQAVLIPLKKEKVYTCSILCGACINLVINIITIPHYGAIGAAVGTIIAEMTVTCIQFFEVKKCIGLSIRSIILSCKTYYMGTLIIGIVGLLLSRYLPNNNIYLFVIIMACAIIYFLVLFLEKDELLIRFINKRKKGENNI